MLNFGRVFDHQVWHPFFCGLFGTLDAMGICHGPYHKPLDAEEFCGAMPSEVEGLWRATSEDLWM